MQAATKRGRPVDPNSKRQIELAERKRLLHSQAAQATHLPEPVDDAVPVATEEQLALPLNYDL